jgi:hypothetical protein
MVKCPRCTRKAHRSTCNILEDYYYKTYLDCFKCYHCDTMWSLTYNKSTRNILLSNQLQTANSNRYNHNQLLSYFKDDLDIITEAGFNVLGFTIMQLKSTFIFETKNEAARAYNELEKTGKVQGWWYGLEDFKLAQMNYPDKLLVYYLKE